MSTALITQLYIGYFNRAPDPDGLAYWESVLASGKSVTEIAQYFANQTEFKSIYGDVSSPTFDNNAFVTQVYQNLFGRAPDAEGLKYWSDLLAKDAVDPGVFIATVQFSANETASGSDYEALNNKTEAASFFLESLATSGAAYDPAKAKEVVEKVDASPESLNAAKEIVEQYIDDATGQGPDPGTENPGPTDPTPLPLAATLDGTKLNINGHATLVDNGDGTVTISAAGYQTVSMFKQSGGNATFDKIVIDAGEVLTIAGSAFDHPMSLMGKGAVNFTGVTTSQATLADKASYTGINGSNLLFAMNTDFAAADAASPGSIPTQEVPRILANGSAIEGIKFAWAYLDGRYTSEPPNGKLATNLFGLEVAKQYVGLLEADPSNAILDFIAKYSPTRLQLIHDNLLSNASISSSILGSRYGVGATDPDARGITNDQFEALKDYLESSFSDRQSYSGNNSDGINYDKARAFDWSKGIDRPDYVDTLYGNIDASGREGGTQLYFGGGNSFDDFNVVRHEGAGIELSLKAKIRGGDDYTPDLSGQTPAYSVDEGTGTAGWGTPAKWSFDFSVITGLNGRSESLTDYTFKFFIDVDPGTGKDFLEFTLQDDAGTLRWMTAAGGKFGGDDRGGANVEQNSVNIGYSVLLDEIKTHVPTYDFMSGDFDIRLEAYKGTQLLVVNEIDVHVL